MEGSTERMLGNHAPRELLGPGSALSLRCSSRKRCWEFRECDKVHPDGGRCRDHLRSRFGELGGRCCYNVVGTMSEDEPRGIFARSKESCTDCCFYRIMKNGGPYP